MLSSYGLGQDVAPAAPAPSSSLQCEIDGFLLRFPDPSSANVASFLKLYPSGADRNNAAQALIDRGVHQKIVNSASDWLDTSGSITKSTVFGVLSIASAALSGFHGVRRNRGSIGWGLWWFAMGGLFPVVTPVIAIAQGFGKPKAC